MSCIRVLSAGKFPTPLSAIDHSLFGIAGYCFQVHSQGETERERLLASCKESSRSSRNLSFFLPQTPPEMSLCEACRAGRASWSRMSCRVPKTHFWQSLGERKKEFCCFP
uniref:Uncharacterized protein n=1 Tax=Pseudonaja textilis TaxID=8673 RepID=A0A670XWG3_PSETE